MGRRIIFLDNDGVLINSPCLRRDAERILTRIGSVKRAHPDCVAALNLITDETGAELVLSSTWREEGDIESLTDVLRAWGVTGTLLDATPALPHRARGEEIQHWLDHCGLDIESFLILEDDSEMPHLEHRVVRTLFEPGLTMADALRAIILLRDHPTRSA